METALGFDLSNDYASGQLLGRPDLERLPALYISTYFDEHPTAVHEIRRNSRRFGGLFVNGVFGFQHHRHDFEVGSLEGCEGGILARSTPYNLKSLPKGDQDYHKVTARAAAASGAKVIELPIHHKNQSYWQRVSVEKADLIDDLTEEVLELNNGEFEPEDLRQEIITAVQSVGVEELYFDAMMLLLRGKHKHNMLSGKITTVSR